MPTALELPLIVIVGPTASGKTALAIKLAEEFNGEIVCADSRTVYKGLTIGTAKPTPEEQQLVPHWGLDLVGPTDHYNVAKFKTYATEKIQEIRARGHVPFLVGGTGLYVDAIIFNYQFGPEPEPGQRQRLNSRSVEDLQKYCINNNVKLPQNKDNKRYLVRAIEQKGISPKRSAKPIGDTIIVGITTKKEELKKRISKRARQMFTDGVVEEATTMGKKYGWQSEAMTGNIYRILHRYIDGADTKLDAIDKITTVDWHLAKRQLTWFKRNPWIIWGTSDQLYHKIKQGLVQKYAILSRESDRE